LVAEVQPGVMNTQEENDSIQSHFVEVNAITKMGLQKFNLVIVFKASLLKRIS